MKLEFCRSTVENSSNKRFHEHLSSRSRVVPRGRTDRHDHGNSCFSEFCESAKKWYYFLFWKCMLVFTFRFPTKCNGIRWWPNETGNTVLSHSYGTNPLFCTCTWFVPSSKNTPHLNAAVNSEWTVCVLWSDVGRIVFQKTHGSYFT